MDQDNYLACYFINRLRSNSIYFVSLYVQIDKNFNPLLAFLFFYLFIYPKLIRG